ncbi:MAG: chemotaxis protein CheV, partial [Anaerolineae bacterium]|nr:chemotaxis protein CheV [Anaerolineae bacterium]
MSGKIDQAGHLELLLFRLNGKQRYGINVFKVQEVMPCPTLTDLPDSHPSVQGVANMRGHTIPVFDLSSAIGLGQHLTSNECHVIVTEFSRAMHGMLVREVEKIVTLAWDQILPPPKGMGKAHYLTAVAE